MSFQELTWAVNQKTGNPADKILLFMAANGAVHETKEFSPDFRELSHECDMTYDEIWTSLKRLELNGFIIPIKRNGGRGDIAERYKLNIDVDGGAAS